MSFIRAKEIPPHSGNWYDYEVKTTHVNGKIMQKVIKYLGRSGSHSYLSNSDEGSNFKMIISPNRTNTNALFVIPAKAGT